MFNIENFLDLTGYDNEIRKQRRKGPKNSGTQPHGGTQEFFTPYSIVKKMCDKIDEDTWADSTKTFLEPCAGNFQFVCYIIWNRIQHGIDWKTTLETCYCVELMQDNIEEGKARVHELLRNIAPDYSPNIADEIMDKNFVCHDFFTWNFEEWRPYTEKELNPKKRKK